MKKLIQEVRQIVSENQTQAEIDKEMKSIVDNFSGLLVGLEHAKGVEPIRIEVDESFKLVQQKRRPVSMKYVERFETLSDNLESKGIVSGYLDHKSATD